MELFHSFYMLCLLGTLGNLILKETQALGRTILFYSMSQSFDFDSTKQWAILAFDYALFLSLSIVWSRSLWLCSSILISNLHLSGYFDFRQCCLTQQWGIDYTLLESSMESLDCAFSIQAASHSTVLSQYKQGVVYFLNRSRDAFSFRTAFSIFKQWAIRLCFSLLAVIMLSLKQGIIRLCSLFSQGVVRLCSLILAGSNLAMLSQDKYKPGFILDCALSISHIKGIRLCLLFASYWGMS